MDGRIVSLLLLLIIACTVQDEPYVPSYHETLAAGGEWFLNSQDDDFLHYRYYMDSRTGKGSHALREMGALWSINMLYDHTGDERYKDLAERGYDYFSRYFVEDDGYIYVNITSDIKLGYNAFIMMSMLKMDEPDIGKMKLLAEGIMRQQRPDGYYETFFFSDRATGVDYYPGQAILALMSMQEQYPDDRYMESVGRAFSYYSDDWGNKKRQAFIPWYTRGFHKYYNFTKDREVSDFIFEMNDWLVRFYAKDGTCKNYDFPGTATPVFGEAMVQAYQLAEELGDRKRMDCYRDFILEAAFYTSTLQSLDPDPRAYGGFMSSSREMRVDSNQHAVAFYIDACDAGIIRCRPV